MRLPAGPLVLANGTFSIVDRARHVRTLVGVVLLRSSENTSADALVPSVVVPLPSRAVPDAELAAALRRGDDHARATFFDRYSASVEKVLWGVLGPEPEVEDLLHEVFLRAFAGIDKIDDPSRLKSWLTGIAVLTAREWIRKKTRRRWLSFVAEVPEPPQRAQFSEEVHEATRETYVVLGNMKEEERVLFSLRFIEGMEMAEIAVACDLSLSTAKRRLKAAEEHFLSRARRVPALREWLSEGGRWPAS